LECKSKEKEEDKLTLTFEYPLRISIFPGMFGSTLISYEADIPYENSEELTVKIDLSKGVVYKKEGEIYKLEITPMKT